LEAAKVSRVTRQTLTRLPRDQDMDEATLAQWLATQLPDVSVKTQKLVVRRALHYSGRGSLL